MTQGSQPEQGAMPDEDRLHSLIIAEAKESDEEEAGLEPETDQEDEAVPSSQGEAEAEPETEESQEEPKYKVKIDGEEKELPISELVKGYQLEADYRKKTAKLSEQARQFETERQAIAQMRQTYENQLRNVLTGLEMQANQEFADIKTQADVVKMASEDPTRYLRFHAFQQSVNAAKEAQRQLDEHRRADEESRYQRWVQEEAVKLTEIDPDFRDEKKASAIRKDLYEYITGNGIDPARLRYISAVETVMAKKAMLYDRAQKQAKQAKVAPQPAKTLKPGNSPTSRNSATQQQVDAARERLKKTGRLEDAAEFFKRVL